MIKLFYYYLPIVNIIILSILRLKNSIYYSDKYLFSTVSYIIDIIFIKMVNYFTRLNSFLDFDNYFISCYSCLSFLLLFVILFKKLSKWRLTFISLTTCIILLLFNTLSFLKGIFIIINYNYFVFKLFLMLFISLNNFAATRKHCLDLKF